MALQQVADPTRRYNYAAGTPGAPQLPQQQASFWSAMTPTPVTSTSPASGASPASGSQPPPYPSAPSTFFEPRQAPPVLGRINPRDQLAYDRQRMLAGPMANFLPISAQRPLQMSDIPLLEAGLNFEQLQQAERDRGYAYDQLARARGAIGSDPAAMRARELAMSRAEGGGPFGPDLIEQTLGMIKNRGAVGLEDAQRAATEDLARRGLGGGLMASQVARLQRDAAGDIQRQSTDFKTQAALANEEAQRIALSQLGEITGREDMQRAAIDQLLASLFADTQRAPISLAGLVPTTKKALRRTKAKYTV